MSLDTPRIRVGLPLTGGEVMEIKNDLHIVYNDLERGIRQSHELGFINMHED